LEQPHVINWGFLSFCPASPYYGLIACHIEKKFPSANAQGIEAEYVFARLCLAKTY
jgi:hypothetical protein